MPPEEDSDMSGMFHVKMIEICPMKRHNSGFMKFEYGKVEPVKLRTRFDLLKEEDDV